MQERRFVVGLGNPGRKYAATRHNVGFRVLEALKNRWAIRSARKAFGGELCEARLTAGRGSVGPGGPAGRDGQGGEVSVMLLAPQTYMNCSGRAAAEMAAFYKASAEQILVVSDDMNLPLGRLRIRPGGSAGGHKGLADVLEKLGTPDVPRLRIGIGSPAPYMDAVDFVLSRFTPDEQAKMDRAVQRAAEAVEDWALHGVTFAMDKYNGAWEG
ncbi:MAG: aminoacyl-tRNA hydrolase [Planctomycetes bacterium]|nr:aminoacyl-tRNA hydrolase [Planctomycetota bacterium]